MADLLRRSLMRPFEDLCAKFGTIDTISAAFEDEGFEAVSSSRSPTRGRQPAGAPSTNTPGGATC